MCSSEVTRPWISKVLRDGWAVNLTANGLWIKGCCEARLRANDEAASRPRAEYEGCAEVNKYSVEQFKTSEP
jgi:hypothetical protein